MDTRIQERLEELAGDAPKVILPPPRLATRARRRAAVTLTALAIAGAVLVTGATVGVRVLTRSDATAPAHQPPIDLFAGIRGWITVGGLQLTAIDPANPSSRIQLTADDGVVDSPLAWSSDGTMLLFKRWLIDSTDMTPSELLVMRADGSETLLSQGGSISGASFSPNGRQVVFARTTGNGTQGYTSGIYRISAQGGTPYRLTPAGTTTAYGDPIWSPDALQIAFVGGSLGDPSIDTMRIDGTGVQKVFSLSTGGFIDVAGMSWSPDGAELVFGGMAPDIHTSQIYTIDRAGTDLTQITDNGNYNVWPSWSTRGDRIAYIAKTELVTMNPDGSQIERIATASSEAGTAWDPYPYG